MKNIESDSDFLEMQKELKKLRLQTSLHKNLSSEMERQKSAALEAQGIATATRIEAEHCI